MNDHVVFISWCSFLPSFQAPISTSNLNNSTSTLSSTISYSPHSQTLLNSNTLWLESPRCISQSPSSLLSSPSEQASSRHQLSSTPPLMHLPTHGYHSSHALYVASRWAIVCEYVSSENQSSRQASNDYVALWRTWLLSWMVQAPNVFEWLGSW